MVAELQRRSKSMLNLDHFNCPNLAGLVTRQQPETRYSDRDFYDVCWRMVNVAIALGSNLGDSYQILTEALKVLAATPRIRQLNWSPFYRTEPVGPPQPDYLNACATLTTDLEPQDLMALLLEIEVRFGRVRVERWGPRLLDLDMLLYGDCILDTPMLHLPHPRMRERAFVLVPLMAIAPDWIDPVTGQTIAALTASVNRAEVHRLAMR